MCQTTMGFASAQPTKSHRNLPEFYILWERPSSGRTGEPQSAFFVKSREATRPSSGPDL